MTNPQTESKHVRAEESEDAVRLPKIIEFDELSRCGDEVWISYKGTLYRLQTTKQGKLILTK
ncbi:MAG TPA: hemin uptake protein HemP [Planctomycetaceae bacterium]|nr:hemin uptake protein HemP [Planctomycetaceae bacterium]